MYLYICDPVYVSTCSSHCSSSSSNLKRVGVAQPCRIQDSALNKFRSVSNRVPMIAPRHVLPHISQIKTSRIYFKQLQMLRTNGKDMFATCRKPAGTAWLSL